jgi:hypothetical protein
MTYSTGNNILAADYNTLTTATNSVNEVYADTHSGATTLGTFADYGYGQTAMTSVSATQNITAAQWSTLFTNMRACATHQGSSIVPPVPASGPNIGVAVAALNTPTTMAAAVTTLRSSRINLAVGQSTLTVGSNFVQNAATIPWNNLLVFTFQVEFGSWNNARYFFNSGGVLQFNGSYAPTSTPDDVAWASMLTNMSPLKFNWNSTVGGSGPGGTAIGFYGLTTTYQDIYNRAHGGGDSYSANFVLIQCKYNTTAGVNGRLDFRVALNDNGVGHPLKSGTTTYHMDNVRSTGAIVYPGPAVTVASVGTNGGWSLT